MVKIFLLAIVLLFSGARAQHSLSGIVGDTKDKSALLSDVIIVIPELNRTDVSREGGTYIFRDVGAGLVHLQFSKRGYRSKVVAVMLTDSITVVHVNLDPRGDDEIIGYGGVPGYTKDLPFAANELSLEELRKAGRPELLSSIDIHGVTQAPSGNVDDIVIRGLSGQHIQVVQSGLAIEQSSFFLPQRRMLIDEGTDHLELIRGPAALLYGNGAMGGVLVYKDKPMPARGVVNGDVNLGVFSNTLGLQAGAGVRTTFNSGVFFSADLGTKSQTSYIQGGGLDATKNTEIKDFAFHSKWMQGSAKGVIGLSRPWGMSKLTVAHQNNKAGVIESLTDSAIALIGEHEERNRESDGNMIRQQHTLVSSESNIFIGRSQLQAALGWQRDETVQGDYFPSALKDIILPQAIWNALSGKVQIVTDTVKRLGYTAGVDVRLKKGGKVYYTLDEENELRLAGAFILLRYNLARVKFLGGIRQDFASAQWYEGVSMKENYSITSGSLGMTWQTADALSMHLNVSSGFSIPIEHQGLNNENYLGQIITDKVFKLERNYHVDGGIRLRLTDLTVNLSASYNYLLDYIAYAEPVIRIDEYNHISQADAEIKSGEASVQFHPQSLDWLQLSAGYSLKRGNWLKEKQNLPFMPTDKVSTSVQFQSKKLDYLYFPYARVTWSSYAKQERIAAFESATDSYQLLDVSLGGSFHLGQQYFDISVSVNNILNEGYYNHLSPLKYREPVPVSEMGRNTVLQMHIPIGPLKKDKG